MDVEEQIAVEDRFPPPKHGWRCLAPKCAPDEGDLA
jgi:hypothetical protein